MKTFVIADPRTFDGDCFEVAGRSLRQATAIVSLLGDVLKDAEVMALNAEMERRLQESDDPAAREWDSSPQGKKFLATNAAVADLAKTLEGLERAASYNPRKPPK